MIEVVHLAILFVAAQVQAQQGPGTQPELQPGAATQAEAQPGVGAESQPATQPKTEHSCWAGVEWERYALANGTTVIAVRVPEAGRQALFTFQPIGLVDDKPAQAQYAHVLEHMLIRSTDRGRLNSWGLDVNGETTAMTMRLETLADVSRWDEALDKHAMWMKAGQFDPRMLEQEKKVFEQEVAFTVANGSTGKWAIAAWNQVVRQAMRSAEVRGDAEGAAIETVMEMAGQRRMMGLPPGVLIATIGPLELKKVREDLEREIGVLHDVDAKRPEGVGQSDATLMKAFRADWDVATRHMMKWWRLPQEKEESTQHTAHSGEVSETRKATENPGESEDEKRASATGGQEEPEGDDHGEAADGDAVVAIAEDDATDRGVIVVCEHARLHAAAAAVGRAVQTRLMTGELRQSAVIRNVQVTPWLETADGARLMLVDCCTANDANEETVWKAIDSAVRQECAAEGTGGFTAMGANMMLGEMGVMKGMTGGQAIKAIRDQARAAGNQRMAEYAEMNWFLPRLYMEYEWGVPVEEAIAGMQSLDADAVARVKAMLRDGKSGTLVLTPDS